MEAVARDGNASQSCNSLQAQAFALRRSRQTRRSTQRWDDAAKRRCRGFVERRIAAQVAASGCGPCAGDAAARSRIRLAGRGQREARGGERDVPLLEHPARHTLVPAGPTVRPSHTKAHASTGWERANLSRDGLDLEVHGDEAEHERLEVLRQVVEPGQALGVIAGLGLGKSPDLGALRTTERARRRLGAGRWAWPVALPLHPHDDTRAREAVGLEGAGAGAT